MHDQFREVYTVVMVRAISQWMAEAKKFEVMVVRRQAEHKRLSFGTEASGFIASLAVSSYESEPRSLIVDMGRWFVECKACIVEVVGNRSKRRTSKTNMSEVPYLYCDS